MTEASFSPTPTRVISSDQQLRPLGEEVVNRAEWEALFERWKTGTLRSEWAAEHPDLFDAPDLAINQPNKYFSEWYAAILIKQKLGFLSLISKYGFHGHKTHLRKQDVLRRYLTPQQHEYVITDPRTLLGTSTGWPDLFVFDPSSRWCSFCEVKGPKDGSRAPQLAVASALENATHVEVTRFTFRFLRRHESHPQVG